LFTHNRYISLSLIPTINLKNISIKYRPPKLQLRQFKIMLINKNLPIL
jgi:hypothetical protein